MSAPVFAAVDSAALGAGWEVQDVQGSIAPTHVEESGANGDTIAETSHNPMDTGTVKAIYTGAETNFVTAFASLWPGKLIATNTILVMSLGIDFAPCASGKRPMVTISGRGNPPAAPTAPYWYATALTLPTYVAAALIVPTILTVTAGDAECQSASWELSMQVGDDLGRTGGWLAGAGYEGQETITLQTVGKFTSVTSSGWIQNAGPSALLPNSTNAGYNKETYTFIRKVSRVTA